MMSERCHTCEQADDAYWDGVMKERRRIAAMARQWAIDYEGGAEGAGMPDLDLYLLMAKSMRMFARELDGGK